MTLTAVLLNVALVVCGLLLVSVPTVVGVGRLRAFRADAGTRIRETLPYLLLLVVVLALNSVLREIGPDVSWIIGTNITPWISSTEGMVVARLQQYASPPLTAYFSAVYVYGYVFLAGFPIIAYLVAPERRPIRETAIAYSLNYALGIVCYILFIAYGPRNVMPGAVDQLLYTTWPESQLLTSEVNSNVNVFPSLHTSLALTVVGLAVRTRETYPRWLPISTVLGVSVTVSTMYLGIHWGIDVLGGIVLAVVSVGGAVWLTSPNRQGTAVYRAGKKARSVLVDRPVEYLLDR